MNARIIITGSEIIVRKIADSFCDSGATPFLSKTKHGVIVQKFCYDSMEDAKKDLCKAKNTFKTDKGYAGNEKGFFYEGASCELHKPTKKFISDEHLWFFRKH